MNHSESVAKLAAALSKAQGEMENADKSSNNPFFGSKYADLAEVINTARPVLAKHGLSVVQLPGFDGSTVTLENVILHESGEWIAAMSGAPMPVMTKKDGTVLPPSPQGVGSAITYLRRYSLAAMCLIAQEDDDAEAASAPARATAARYEAEAAANERTGYATNTQRPSEPVGVTHSNAFDLGEPIQVGKHKGKSWAEVVETDPQYVEWAVQNLSRLTDAAKQVLRAALALHHAPANGVPLDRNGVPLNQPEPDGLPF